MSPSRRYLFAIALLASSLAGSADGAALVGQLASDDVRIDGLAAPAGTTVLDGVLLTAGSRPAVVHLEGGGLVELTPGSEARFRSSADGVQVAVASGAISYLDAGGRIATAGGGSVALVTFHDDDPDEAPLPEDERVEVCHLVNHAELPGDVVELCRIDPNKEYQWGPDDLEYDCEWERIEIWLSRLEEHISDNRADIAIDDDLRDRFVRLPSECQPGAILWWKWSAGVVGSGLILDHVLDEDEMSPVRPRG